MPPASLVLSKAVVAPIPNGDGTGCINTTTLDVSTNNQPDSYSFPLILKKIAPIEKGQVKDEPSSMSLAADGKIIPSKEVDATLPPPGMILPYMLSQSLPSDSAPLEGKTSTINPPNDSARDSAIYMMANQSDRSSVKQPGEKLLSSVQQTSRAVDAENSSSLTTATDLSPSYTPLTNTGDFRLHDTRSAIQTFMNGIGAISAQHDGGASTSHAGLDTVSADATMNSVLQGGDKISQNTITTSIAIPLRHPEWSDELSNRVTWMIRQDMQSASVKINPSHLGPLDMKVSIINDQVNISFSSHHAPVREALDASIPRLREMLSDNGLQLGDASITHQSFSDQNQTNEQTYSQSNGLDGQTNIDLSGENIEDTIKDTSLSIFTSAAIDIYA